MHTNYQDLSLSLRENPTHVNFPLRLVTSALCDCVWPPACVCFGLPSLSYVERKTSHCRYLAAARDIKPGEVILKEAPLIIGPRLEGAPVCMGCFNILANPHTCSNCHLAELCSPACESNPNHAGKECELLGELCFRNDSSFQKRGFELLPTPTNRRSVDRLPISRKWYYK